MDAAEILNQLTHAEGLPKAALQAATAQRRNGPKWSRSSSTRSIPIWRSTRPAGRRRLPSSSSSICSASGGRNRPTGGWRGYCDVRNTNSTRVLGDAITSTSHRVMAAVFDADPAPLYEIILDQSAEQFVRSRMCEVHAMLVLRGDLDRASIERFLRDGFDEILPQAQCCVWRGWQSAVAMLGLSELTILVRRAFDRGFIDRSWLGFEDFQRNLRWAIKRPGEPRHAESSQFTLFGNTVDELSRWDGFREDVRGGGARDRHDGLDQMHDHPYRNQLRGVGRNDPCPCGSGKKFKNCCLGR